MGLMPTGTVVPNSGLGSPLRNAGAPVSAVADVQTFTCTGTPTSGTFTYTVTNPLTNQQASLVIPYNCSAATLQPLCDAIFGAGNTVTSGGPWPGTALVITGAGALADIPIPIAVATNGFTGGTNPSASVAHTTTGVADVQTFTCTGTPTGGTFTWNVTNPLTGATGTLVIPYNCSATTLGTLATAFFGTGNITAGGGPWPGTALVITGAGAMGSGTIAIATAGTNALTGGTTPTSTVAHTTVGIADVLTYSTSGSPTGGSFSFQVYNALTTSWSTLVIPQNCTAAYLTSLLASVYGSSNYVGGGGPWPATPLTATSAGAQANQTITLPVPSYNTFGGGTTPTSTVAHTTVGVAATYAGKAAIGAALIDTTNAERYTNTGTITVPVWTKDKSLS